MSWPRAKPAAVFLDRDGVVNRRIVGGWVREPARLEVLPGVLDAIVALTRAGRAPILVSNQSGIGRGVMTRAEVDAVHAHLRAQVERAGGQIRDVYVCPHAPSDGCRCRKPGPELFERAAREHGIDLSLADLVGDSPSDIGAARAAGLARALLVTDPAEPYPDDAPRPDATFASLREAVEWLLARPAVSPSHP